HRYLQQGGELGLWKIEEPEAYFLERMQLTEVEQQQLGPIQGHRRLEWLAGRWLLHIMSGRDIRGACLKDEYGKPYLENSAFDISISHSRELAAVMAAARPVGIDIQKIVSKIERIAHKFMRTEEMDSLELPSRIVHLHVYWGAKEALYKAYGRKKLEFKEHILIQPFEFDPNGGTVEGRVEYGDFKASYQLGYEIVGAEFVLVYGKEQNRK
ncbi:MAG: 4'-phosphopantetheinyl transferase superfamily protein, partial [Bacteroidota bacterium]